MYSVKPGRGPSLIGAILALVVGVPFVLFWIGTASKMGAPGFFVFFGIMMLVAILVSVFIGFYNATSRDRISQFDITTKTEESDPFDRLVQTAPPEGQSGAPSPKQPAAAKPFCPYCGASLAQEFKFCPECGKPQSFVGSS